MANTLSTDFLTELLRLCFLKKSVLERCALHLKYQYLPSPELKRIYKDITDYYAINNSLPTFGVIYEKNKNDDKVISVLKRVKESEIVDPEPVFKQLEKYIKDVRFSMLWEEVVDIHKKGDSDKAMRQMMSGSQEIVEFSIFKDSGTFLRVFKDFQKVQLDKQITKEDKVGGIEKIPFGILPCDIISHGGMDRKDTVLWLLRSGVGKSTALKWQGMYACRLGYDVLHIQLEGSSAEVYDKYTQIWSAMSYHAIKSGDIQGEDYAKLLSIANDMVVLNQDVCIKSYEQFDEATMVDVRDSIVEYVKEFGKPPDLLLLDSLDLVHPGDGIKYGADTQSVKMKLQNSARKFKNICNEFDIRGVTASQTSDVKEDTWNDPNKVISRSDSMGDKNIANVFSYVLSGNQTRDEEKSKTMRIYFDKVRYYNSGEKVYPIATNYSLGRFYDAARTKKLFSTLYPES